MTLTFAAFDQTVSLLLLDDGVLQLLPKQAPAATAQKNIAKILQSLALYDINRVYADADAMQRRGISPEDTVVPVTSVDAVAIAALLLQHRTVLSF